MRADRLIRVLLMLQSRPAITAAALAAELEVSVPTARRDLEALMSAGVPVYPQRGRGGGWALVGGARTNLTGLTEPEAQALFALFGELDGAPGEVSSAVSKLLQALPATFRAGAERAAAAQVAGPRWGRDDRTPPAVAVLRSAIVRRRLVCWRSGDPPVSVPAVVPLVVARRGEQWYLLAAPAGADGVADPFRARMHRVQRMVDLQVTQEPGGWPADFDARASWAAAVDEVESLRNTVRAEVLVAPRAVGPMTDVLGDRAVHRAAGPPELDGRVRVTVTAHRVDALAEQLAGWSAVAEVTGPPEVRAALAALGARLLAAYGPVAAPEVSE
jgi:predicted DNA-binding transcriptional regulator YafY